MSQILNEHWQEFKKTKLYKVSEHMRKSVIEAVEKALGCGDIKEGYTKFSVSNVTVGMKLSWDYEENPIAVVFVIIGFVLLVILLIIKLYMWKKKPIDTLGIWLSDVGKYAGKRFKELIIKKENT